MSATASEMEIFRKLANPQKISFNQSVTPSSVSPPLADIPEDTEGSERSDNRSQMSLESGRSQEFENASFVEHTRETQELEKQGLLFELSKFKQNGVLLTRDYTMADTYQSIKFEYDRIVANQEQITKVNYIRDALFMLFRGVELGNRKIGPILRLDGWADEVSRDKHQYDHALERVYRKYWRHGMQMSPVMELTLGIGMSMFMFHFKQGMGGGQDNSQGNNQGNSQGNNQGNSRGNGHNEGSSGGMAGMAAGLSGLMGSIGGGGSVMGGGRATTTASASPSSSNTSSRPIMRPPQVRPSSDMFSESSSVSLPPVQPRGEPSAQNEELALLRKELAARDAQVQQLMGLMQQQQKQQQQVLMQQRHRQMFQKPRQKKKRGLRLSRKSGSSKGSVAGSVSSIESMSDASPSMALDDTTPEQIDIKKLCVKM